MAPSRRKYRPPEPGPLHLRESVRSPLLALAGDRTADARLEVALVESVERALRCELPDELLACFANGDGILPERGFRLSEVADLTSQARELGCPSGLVAVGRCPPRYVLYCVDRRGDRRRAVGLTEFEVEGQDTSWRDLGELLADLADRESSVCSRPSPDPRQPSLFLDFKPRAAEPRAWLLVE